jgi:hypothetical protein
MKICCKCNTSKKLEEFYVHKTTSDRHFPYCKECQKSFTKQWQRNNPEKIKESNRKRYRTNPDKVKLLIKKWQRNNPEKIKIYRQNHNSIPSNIFKRYKKSKNAIKHGFSITFEEFIAFWQKPCTYCNSDIKTIGLDRIDSKKGYHINNVLPCCSTCNWMKCDYDTSLFLEHIHKIEDYQQTLHIY